jgi:superfamily II DNA or RNA helicase/uncharacterized protein (DUF3820 family)
MRMLVLAHRSELIYQAAATARNAGLSVGIEMGGHRAGREDVVVSTVQTQIATSKCKACLGEGCELCEGRGRRFRMEKFDPFEFGLVIVDEAHHATAKSYRTVGEYFRRNPAIKFLMVTATPKRADGVGLHNVCDSVAYEMDLKAAIAEGWLCPIRQRFVTVDSLDLSNVGTKMGGDLADGDLERAFLSENTAEENERLHSIAKPSLDEAGGRPLLVFASGQEHAIKLTAAFNAYEGVSAELVIDKTDKDERKRIVDRYKSGATQVLVGVGVFTEGFDAPNTAVVAVARPTKSESLYLQMIGRGTRPVAGIVDGVDSAEDRKAAIAASAKPTCVILDFVGNSGRHKLISVVDVLAGSDVDPIDLEAALKAAKDVDAAVDMEELIDKAKQAREERERRKAEQARQRMMTNQRADRAEYSAQDVDLFRGGNFDPFTDYEPTPWGATPKQVNRLIAMGVSPEQATKYSKGQAGKVIDSLMKTQVGGDYRMPFGKHKGTPLKALPNGYLQWAEKNLEHGEIQRNIQVMKQPQPMEMAPF